MNKIYLVGFFTFMLKDSKIFIPLRHHWIFRKMQKPVWCELSSHLMRSFRNVHIFSRGKKRSPSNITSTNFFFPLAIHLFSCFKTLVIFEKMVTLCNLSRRIWTYIWCQHQQRSPGHIDKSCPGELLNNWWIQAQSEELNINRETLIAQKDLSYHCEAGS